MKAPSALDLSVDVISQLTKRDETIATAESLTAGLVAATLAAIPGASAVLRGGLIVYATDLKETIAGVSSSTLDLFGAVSDKTSQELAIGATSRCAADWGIGITGVAGPTEQEGQPVGTVWCTIYFAKTGEFRVQNFHQRFTDVGAVRRPEIRELAVCFALENLRLWLDELSDL